MFFIEGILLLFLLASIGVFVAYIKTKTYHYKNVFFNIKKGKNFYYGVIEDPNVIDVAYGKTVKECVQDAKNIIDKQIFFI